MSLDMFPDDAIKALIASQHIPGGENCGDAKLADGTCVVVGDTNEHGRPTAESCPCGCHENEMEGVPQ